LLQLSGGVEEGVGESEGGVVHAGGQDWQQLDRDVSVRPPRCAQSRTAMNRPMAAASRTPPARSTAVLQ
jgi:hypothetical protein